MDELIVKKLSELFINDIQGCLFDLRVNMTSENSIIVIVKPSLYLGNASPRELLFAWVKVSGKLRYVRFSEKYKTQFSSNGIPYFKKNKDDSFIRIDINIFSDLLSNTEKAHLLLKPMLTDLFSSDVFGCCSKYEECSDNKECVHPDRAFAMACQYKRNLDNGRIFYGVNRNI